MSRALYRLLSPALVHEAFKRLNVYSSPGEDGMSMTIFQQFVEFYEPLMLDIAHRCFNTGSLPPEWALVLINCIPKCAGPATIAKLRPIAL